MACLSNIKYSTMKPWNRIRATLVYHTFPHMLFHKIVFYKKYGPSPNQESFYIFDIYKDT